MTTITSSELNYIVFRYLQESGYEAAMDKETSIDANAVPYGALITLVQKGLQYLEMEANSKIDDPDAALDFSFIKPFDLLGMTVDQLKQIVEEKKELDAAKELERLSKGKEKEEDAVMVISDNEREKKHDKVKFRLKTSASFGGHSDEVHSCAWSPTGLLASGSADATARIWSIADKTNSESLVNRLAGMRVLYHAKSKANEKRKDVTTLDWNPDGTLLATGSHDGLARIWNTNGELMRILNKHKGPIYSVKWNKRGDYLLTGSFDGSAIVWDVNAAAWIQQFEFNSGPILDVDWRTNRTFASCTSNSMIHVCKIGQNQPINTFSGHKDKVNCVKWDPSGRLLASCSVDRTVKVWSMKQDTPLHDFRAHAKEINIVRWSLAELKKDHPDNTLLLATASFDSTVKLWDIEAGTLYHRLSGHRDAVFSMSFSPNGEYLATGSRDKLMNIWSVREGKIIKTYFGNGGISQVSWNNEGNKIAYCTTKNNVCVSDFRK